MKKVISELKRTEILVEEVREGTLAAYRMASDKGAYAVLAKVSSGYGFIPLNNSDASCRYPAVSWYGSLDKAAQCRDVRVFNSHDEMIKSMYKKEF